MKILKLILISVLMISFTGCSTDKSEDSEKLKIAVAIEPIRYFAERIFSDEVDVITMIPQGASPANYEISTAQMMEFEDTDIYFTLSLPAEINSIIDAASDDTEIVNMNEIVNSIYEPLKLGESDDPHIWMSISRAKVMIETLLYEVSEADPDNKEFYQENAEQLISELEELDNEIKEELEGVESRGFIVYHPSLQYFADEYDLEMIPIESEGKEASANRLAEIIDLARDNDIRVIFYQAEIDSSQAESIANEIDGVTTVFNPLAYDYIESYRQITKVIRESFR